MKILNQCKRKFEMKPNCFGLENILFFGTTLIKAVEAEMARLFKEI